MSFEDRARKRMKSLRDDVVASINREIEFNKNLFSLLDDEDWEEIYSGLEISFYFEVRNGVVGICVFYGPDKKDHKFFPMEPEIRFTVGDCEYPRADFDKMADEFERFAKLLRDPAHAF